MVDERILLDSAARRKTLTGATQLACAIRATPKPESISELIQKKWGPRLGCNDAVNMSKELSQDGEQTVVRAERLRQAAEILGDVAGNSQAVNTNRTRRSRQKIETRHGDFGPEKLKRCLTKLSSDVAITPVGSTTGISNCLPSRYPSCKGEG